MRNLKSMNINKFVLLFLTIISFSTLSAQMINNVTVSGKITNGNAKKMVYLLELSGDAMKPLDSVRLKADNSFMLGANIKNANFFQVSLGDKAYTILILEPGQHVKMDIDANDMMSPKNLKGSSETVKVYQILNVLNSYKGQQDALESEYQKAYGTAYQDSVSKVLTDKYQKIETLKLNYLRSEISTNPGLSSMLFIDQLPIDKHLDVYEKLDNVVYKKYPENAFVGDLHRKVSAKLRLAVGRPAPEINLPSPEGPYVKLSSLKGKVVLIDFWASWCSPCRRENPNVVKIYNKYKDMGFEIYGVSLDKEKSKWVEAIKADNLTWKHVSDLRFWNSVAAKDYGVGGIPFTVLIDRDGKVIATGLRGEELENKLAEIFGK